MSKESPDIMPKRPNMINESIDDMDQEGDIGNVNDKTQVRNNNTFMDVSVPEETILS